jgi:hypothetical protein
VTGPPDAGRSSVSEELAKRWNPGHDDQVAAISTGSAHSRLVVAVHTDRLAHRSSLS